jgi:DNA helicase MCM9
MNADPVLGMSLLRSPDSMISLFKSCISRLQLDIISQLSNNNSNEAAQTLSSKRFCNPRFASLPGCNGEVNKQNISSIRCDDFGKLVSISGTIIRTGIVKMLEFMRDYECSKCHHRFHVVADLEQNNSLEVPKTCPNPSKKCHGVDFNYLEGSRVCRDYQEIKVLPE